MIWSPKAGKKPTNVKSSRQKENVIRRASIRLLKSSENKIRKYIHSCIHNKSNFHSRSKISHKKESNSNLDGKKIVPDNKYNNDDDNEEQEVSGKKLEDVRMSNFAYSQLKIAELISAFFAMLGIGSCIVGSEINAYHNLDEINKDNIIVMIAISNISTLFLSKISPIISNSAIYRFKLPFTYQMAKN